MKRKPETGVFDGLHAILSEHLTCPFINRKSGRESEHREHLGSVISKPRTAETERKSAFLAPSDNYIRLQSTHLITPIRQKTTSASQARTSRTLSVFGLITKKSTGRIYKNEMAPQGKRRPLIPPSGSLQFPRVSELKCLAPPA